MIELLLLSVLIHGIVGPDVLWGWYPPHGGNNVDHPDWGVPGDIQIWDYPTMTYSPYYNYSMPGPRVISNKVGGAPQGISTLTPRNITHYLTVWAQFLDHDIIKTPGSTVSLDIPVPKGDPYFDPDGKGNVKLSFTRSKSHPLGTKYKINDATCWIDGSQIYGSTYEVAALLREYKGGRLRTSKVTPSSLGELPPTVGEFSSSDRVTLNMANDAGVLSNNDLFACGDVRCNENPLLTSLHILFLREHNRVAAIIAKNNPSWDDSKIFHRTRRYIIAELQQITLKEYLFWLFGGRTFPKDISSYNSSVDPRIHIFFSTVSFRYGHSEISNLMKLAKRAAFGLFPFWTYVDLKNQYFDNRLLKQFDVGYVWLGTANALQQSMDHQVDDVVRNFLFQGSSTKPSKDLYSIDIQRSRDHGVPLCNAARIAYNLKPFEDWKDFDPLNNDNGQNPKVLLSQLMATYNSPDETDAIVCGLAEDWIDNSETIEHNDYSNLGSLFEESIAHQFQRLIVGDRFWYSRNLPLIEQTYLPPIETRTLANIIRDNTKIDVSSLQDNVFRMGPLFPFDPFKGFSVS